MSKNRLTKFIKRLLRFFLKRKKILRAAPSALFYGGVVFLVVVLMIAITVFLKIYIERQIERSLSTKLKEIFSISILEPTPVLEKIITEKSAQAPFERLVPSSFTDLFSGVGWLDQGATTLYRDNTTTAFTFPPVFGWQKIDSPSLSDGSYNFLEKRSDGTNLICIKNRCLAQNGLELRYSPNSSPVSVESFRSDPSYRRVDLPAELEGKSLVNISIGALDSVWLLGAVTKDISYEGFVFFFDGNKFTRVQVPILSSYEGTLGFGGSDDDWLIVYGAYDGLAYRIRPAGETLFGAVGPVYPVRITDLSGFFGIRLMDGGFEPAVLRVGSADTLRWYVFSLTAGKPKLIKLFHNQAEEISGVVSFSDKIFGGDVRKASFGFQGTNPQKLLAKVDKGAGEELWEFSDLGFDKARTLDVFSSNINNYPAEVRTAKITELDFSPNGARVNFFVTNDGRKWYNASPGSEIVFPNKEGRELRWRATFIPDSNPDTSPFLDRLRLDYQVKFL